MDSNSNPDGIDFPIPGNDDARRSIDLYCNLIKETIFNAKKTVQISEEKVTSKSDKKDQKEKTESKDQIEITKKNSPLN